MTDETILLQRELACRAHYDLIVAGGGVAGVAAALTARRRGLRVLLVEKSNILGGLATLGLVNFFVPMCNGRGKQIIFGLADEWFRASALYGYDCTPEDWRDGAPERPTQSRMVRRYSPYIFALQLVEMIRQAGVALLFDCIAAEPVMQGNRCRGIITESKSGLEYYSANAVIDATGDADVLRRAGVPVVLGSNYYTYIGKQITLESCRRAVESRDLDKAYSFVFGGDVNLYGEGQPIDKPLWSGTTVDEVTEYLIDSQLTLLNRIKSEPRRERDIAMLPMMPNFRTTCRLDGDYTLKEADKGRYFEDSIGLINDFDRRDFLYEVPLRCLTRHDLPNLLTAGRSISAEGYAWDVVRVIPPAIVTGQAAGEIAALSLETGRDAADVDISVLQRRLKTDDGLLIHCKDAGFACSCTDAHTEAPDKGDPGPAHY